ncbi:hypothetical protein [Yersinia mollaretii]|uniref:hypothetical protein n=1 Tax=Yersinia mollaretii TaxID=33060 RepID=UPI0011A4C8E4|nr:hypothetical protein [Yersinia mollaretii]
MAKVSVNYKIDEELKKRVDEKLALLDIPVTTAVTGLYQYIEQHSVLPFIIQLQVQTAEEMEKTIIALLYGVAFHLQGVIAEFETNNTQTNILKLNNTACQIKKYLSNYIKMEGLTVEQRYRVENVMDSMMPAVSYANLFHDYFFERESDGNTVGLLKLKTERFIAELNVLDNEVSK